MKRYETYKDSGIQWWEEIPTHWDLKKAKHMFSLITENVSNPSLPKIALENIESWTGRFIETDSDFMGEGVEFKKDDILYSEIRPANKRYAYVDFEETERYIASTKLMVLRPKKDVVLPRFLFAFLSSNHVLAELQHLAETRSGTFPQITFSSELAPMPIEVPDFETQEKIVGMLASIEGRIQNNNEINENLREQRAGQ